MEPFENSDYYQKELNKYLDKYGDVPPPWVYAPDSHPYSIQWRMGSGETHIMMFFAWYGRNLDTEADRINYFRKYPAPPRWLGWMADAIWDLEPMDEEFDYSEYFEKLKAYGFEGTEKYMEDLTDEKWIDNN
ncbi:hypothetical protein GCM10009122_60960 [Fulvivirga kasyanovii]|uniref:Uncharacterized protein n=1 Tax=Fulvivirga kasyanovii TaxID=396812 RepID=A0ABW9RS28_9BACT|nr:hypothetical protein [Fulvivirga kasyanovii]MTI26972.1 hypothetical protein [Fulvivirga kasyanovii]